MPAIAVLVVGKEEQKRFARRVGAGFAPRFCETAGGLVTLVSAGGIRGVVAEPQDAEAEPVADALIELAGRYPEIPIALYIHPTPVAARALVAVLERGAAVQEYILSEHGRPDIPLRRMLSPRSPPGATGPLLRRIVPPALHLASGRIAPFAAITIMMASPGLRVRQIAAWMGVTARALEMWLHQTGLPEPHVLMRQACGLHVAWWIDTHGWTAKRVASVMHFPDEGSVTRCLKQYWGCTVRTLRSSGGFAGLAARYEATYTTPHPRSGS